VASRFSQISFSWISGTFDEANLSTSRSQEEVPTTGNWGALRIVIEPTDKRRKWIARLDGRVLCVAAKHIVEHKGDYDRAKGGA
jgi:hypothetical protein